MTIAIIGFSRFGQLWARLMKPYGRVMVFNRSDQKDLADEMGVEFYGFNNLEKLKEADWVFVAVAIVATEEIIKRIKFFVGSDSLVMDVCSVKTLPVKWLEDNLDDSIEIMGIHPMFGPSTIEAGLEGKQVVLCPVRISGNNLKKVRKVFEDLKLEIIETTPEDHDRQTAYSLAMVHFLGRGLDKLNLDQIRITTLGFDRLMKVHKTVTSNSLELFDGIQRFNPCAKEARSDILKALIDIDEDLIAESK